MILSSCLSKSVFLHLFAYVYTYLLLLLAPLIKTDVLGNSNVCITLYFQLVLQGHSHLPPLTYGYHSHPSLFYQNSLTVIVPPPLRK